MPNNTTLKFIEIPEFGLTIGAAPKIASSTLHISLRQYYGHKSLPEIPEVRILRPNLVTGRTVIWTRSPYDRFKSLWRNKCIAPCGKLAGHPDVAGMTPDELFRYTQRHDNHHWLPLSKMIDDGDFRYNVPTPEFVPIEFLDEWWAMNLPMQMHKSNTTKDMLDKQSAEFNFTHLREFEERYWDDAELHNESLRDYLDRRDSWT